MNLVHELSALDSPAPCGCGSPWTAARRRAAACTSGSAARPRRRGTPPTRAPSGPTPPARSPPSPGRTHRIAATPSCDAETPSRQRLAASPNVLQIGMAPPGRIRGWFEGKSVFTSRVSPPGPLSISYGTCGPRQLSKGHRPGGAHKSTNGTLRVLQVWQF
jgi:hypothetical protein